MIRITVEIVPHGEELLAEKIGEITIANSIDHPKRPEYGNYRAKLWLANENFKGEKTANTVVHNHLRSHSIWTLLARVLEPWRIMP